LKGDEIESMEE